MTSKDPNDSVRDSLDEVVERLDQSKGASDSWESSIHADPKKWEELKRRISEKQKELKKLVESKKAGDISQDAFDTRYKELQDELTRLEFEVYNMRLGTNIEL